MLDDCAPRLVPAQGWHYPEFGPENPIRADSFESLEDAITKSRVANGTPIGNPGNDIRKFVRENYPHSASALPQPRGEDESPSRNSRDRTSQWLSNRYSQRAGGIDAIASQSEADRRSEICASCPQNQNIKEDCAPCISEINRRIFLLSQGQDTNPKVKMCLITGQSNRVACFLPEGKMFDYTKKYQEQLKSTAPHCWMIEK